MAKHRLDALRQRFSIKFAWKLHHLEAHQQQAETHRLGLIPCAAGVSRTAASGAENRLHAQKALIEFLLNS